LVTFLVEPTQQSPSARGRRSVSRLLAGYPFEGFDVLSQPRLVDLGHHQ
jgi:hypothetical protein